MQTSLSNNFLRVIRLLHAYFLRKYSFAMTNGLRIEGLYVKNKRGAHRAS